MCQAESNRSHHRYKMEFKHTLGYITNIGRNNDDEFELLGVSLADIMNEGNMVGHGRFQIIRTFITCLQ